MLAGRVAKPSGKVPNGSGLTRGDIDAVVWRRLKVAKALGIVPNLWEFSVSTADAALTSLSELSDLCACSVLDAITHEGLGGERPTVTCGRSGTLAIGHIRVSCERVDERTLTTRISAARVSGAEVCGQGSPVMATCSWDGTSIPIIESVTIGRDPSCDIHLDGYGVSRHHGQIVDEGAGRMRYIDRSTNGSLVDGVFVCGASVVIHKGSRIGIVPGVYVEVGSVT